MTRTVSAQHVLVDGQLRPATVTVAEGQVVAIGPHDPAADLALPDSATLLPGVVDTHVHVNEPGRTQWEGFATATRAAALGGVTTIVDMPLNSIPPTTTVAALRVKREAARTQAHVDVGFWAGAVPDNLGALEPLWEAGVLGFKCFLSPSGVDEFPALDPEQLHAAMREVAAFDGLLLVHAEDAAVLAAAPQRASRAYADFLLSRPDTAETVAVRRLLDTVRATGCRVHVLHLSSARALDSLAAGRAEGLPVTVETCPHYLCLAAEAIPDGAPEFKCCPPIRDEGNRTALWDALLDGVVDVVVTDHSPATPEVKCAGDGDLQQAWGGISGLQVGFAAVADEARRRGVGLERVAQWMATGTADLVGLARKGRIAVGTDADLVVHDAAVDWQVEAARLAHRHPLSAYDGRRLRGRVTHAWLRGEPVAPVADPDAGTGHQPRGALLERSR